jgi:3-phenylpropionate/trans-cinnamate dioxygenase ferredoxin reductase subunit
VRIESVPNALEQARAIAGWLCGKPKPNRSVPWFWSDQYDLKLQMAGLSQGYDQCVVRGNIETRSFCAFYLAGERVLAVDAVNRPADFMAVRRALARQVVVDPGKIADETIPLKEQLA